VGVVEAIEVKCVAVVVWFAGHQLPDATANQDAGAGLDARWQRLQHPIACAMGVFATRIDIHGHCGAPDPSAVCPWQSPYREKGTVPIFRKKWGLSPFLRAGV